MNKKIIDGVKKYLAGTVGTRLKWLRGGEPVRDFCKRIEWRSYSEWSDIENGKNIGVAKLADVCRNKHLDLSPTWLMFGRGPRLIREIPKDPQDPVVDIAVLKTEKALEKYVQNAIDEELGKSNRGAARRRKKTNPGPVQKG